MFAEHERKRSVLGGMMHTEDVALGNLGTTVFREGFAVQYWQSPWLAHCCWMGTCVMS